MNEIKVNIVLEYDDDYGLPSAGHLHYQQVPLRHSVEDIYGTRWLRVAVGYIELERGKAHIEFDREAEAILRNASACPYAYWDN
jgi:hypothetical protein